MADFLATNDFAGTGAVMQVELNFAGVRLDLPDHPPPYLEVDDVKGVIITPATPTSVETSVPVALTKINDMTFSTTPTVIATGKVLRVYRDTDIDSPIVDFTSLQVVSESDLDNQSRQTLYAVMEARDNASIATDRADGASSVAVDANIASAAAVTAAGEAVTTANSAQTAANAAVTTANAANTQSEQALAAAALAEEHASNVESLAADAQTAASGAQTAANTAVSTANSAAATANAIDGKAQTALDNSAAAVTTANAASATANAVDGKATTALSDSAFAVSTANTALNTANAVDGKAQTALDNSSAALTAANAAQPGDPTLTALAALVTAANKLIYSTGVDTFAQTDLTVFARSLLATADAAAARITLGAAPAGRGHISGLGLVYSGTKSVTVTAGSAYVESLGRVVTLAADTNLTGITTTNSAHHFVYLYESAGAGAIEVSTTVPVKTAGTAYNKTGDTSRRLLGALLTNSSGNFIKFTHDIARGRVQYLAGDMASGGSFTMWTSFSTTTYAIVSAVPTFAPVQIATYLMCTLNSQGGLALFGIPEQDGNAPPGTTNAGGIIVVGTNSGNNHQHFEMPLSRVPATYGAAYVRMSAGSSFAYCHGYFFER
jgi:hypothetical protein